jgi:2-oxoglutarate ferredoxin oxidoreductase subunit beta
MEPGEVQTVDMHDGSHVVLKKLDPKKHDPTDRTAAFRLLEEARREDMFITGLIYLDRDRKSLAEISKLVDEPLAHLPEERLRPPYEELDAINNKLICCD